MSLKNVLSSLATPFRSKMSAGVPCYCVTHAPPLVPAKFFTDIIAIGDYGLDLPLHISKLDRFWHEARPVAFSSAGCFAISRIARDVKSPVIGLCSYRKIILRKEHGLSSSSFLFDLKLADVEQLGLSDTLPAASYEFLVTGPLKLPDGIIGQYAKYHLLPDLLNFTSIAIDLDVLTAEQAKEFLLLPMLIPGGCDFGFYPTQWLLERQMQMELVGSAFIMNYRERLLSYDKFQVRALSFLTERLGSYFVVKELMRRYDWNPVFHLTTQFSMGAQGLWEREALGSIPPEIFGYMHVFVEEYGGYVGGLAE